MPCGCRAEGNIVARIVIEGIDVKIAIPIPNQGAIFVGSSFCSSTYYTVRLRRLNPRRLDFILDLKSV
jgi:hypothetical protein